MIKVSHTTLIVLSGLVWLAVGCSLLPLGINFIVESILNENILLKSRPILDSLAPYVGGLDVAALILIVFGLILGYGKGKAVFAKSVKKSVNRIVNLPNPTSIADIYTKKYYILLGSMVLIGFIVRFTTLDIRGFVDVTIGSALIHGAVLYFLSAFRVYRKKYEMFSR